VGAGFEIRNVNCNFNDPLQKFRWTQDGKIKLIGITDKDLCIGRVDTDVVDPPIQVQACNPTGGNTDINLLKWADPLPATILSFEEELKIRMEFLQNDAQRPCPEIAILRSLSHFKQDGYFSHVDGSCPTVDDLFSEALALFKNFKTNPYDTNILLLHVLTPKESRSGKTVRKRPKRYTRKSMEVSPRWMRYLYGHFKTPTLTIPCTNFSIMV
jgi:hypothetical protein